MKIKNWFKNTSKLDDELTSIKEKETTTLPYPVNQSNTECNLVDQLREKQKELKEIKSEYNSKCNLYGETFQQVLFPKLSHLITYAPLCIYINNINNIYYRGNQSCFRNKLVQEMIEHPIEDNKVDEIIDFFTEYKAMVTNIKDIPNRKKQLTEDIKLLKQQLGIE